MDGSEQVQTGDSKSFALKEWEQCRSQIHLLLSAIWRFEVIAISGFAVFYSWFFSTAAQTSSQIDPLYLLLACCAFSWLILARLKVEYAILITLGEYSQNLEDYIYGKSGASQPVGWETYLHQNIPDKRKLFYVFKRYSNTGMVFAAILAFNVTMLLYFNWGWLVSIL